MDKLTAVIVASLVILCVSVALRIFLGRSASRIVEDENSLTKLESLAEQFLNESKEPNDEDSESSSDVQSQSASDTASETHQREKKEPSSENSGQPYEQSEQSMLPGTALTERRPSNPSSYSNVDSSQDSRARKLFAAVILAALDDAILRDKEFGDGADQIANWARSPDGKEILSCAGIDPNERVVQGLSEFVSRGIRTSVALSRHEQEESVVLGFKKSA